jgi:precorrin-8X/cobalt-precorrin-8 methylmutase
VVESKELIMENGRRLRRILYRCAGRKGGSNVAAAVCNALIYQAVQKQKEK